MRVKVGENEAICKADLQVCSGSESVANVELKIGTGNNVIILHYVQHPPNSLKVVEGLLLF